MARLAQAEGRVDLFYVDPDNIVVIGWDTDDGPEHPLWDARAKLPVDARLVDNIEALQRIIHPAKVRKDGDRIECVVGRQRVKACREVNKRLRARGAEPVRVPVTVAKDEDYVSLGLIISENEQRQGDSLLEKARKAQRYINLGRTESEAAVMFGVSVTAMRQYLSLLDLDRQVQEMVEKRQLSPSAASRLSKLSREEQREQAQKLISEGSATIADVEQAVRRRRAKDDERVRSKAPGRKLLKQIAGNYENSRTLSAPRVSSDFIQGILFCMGEVGLDDVAGLSELLEK